MHLPEGLIALSACAVGYAASIPTVTYAARKVRKAFPQRIIPLMGMMGAFIYAAQIFHIPIPGTPVAAHIEGGTLLAATLGSWPGVLVMSVVYIIQAFLNHDGGITPLGINIFNIAIVGVLVGGFVYHYIVRMVKGKGEYLGVFVGSVVSIMASAFFVATEIAFLPRIDLGLEGQNLLYFYIAILGLHIPVGILEGIISVGVLHIVRHNMPTEAQYRPKVSEVHT